MTGSRVPFFISILLTILSAVLLYLSFPNNLSLFGYNLCAFVFAVPLLFALEKTSAAGRAVLGLIFGYVFHGLVVGWFIPYSLPGYFFFISVLTVQPLIFCVLYRRPSSRRLSALFVPALWVASEYARGLLMQGESWNIGYTQSFNVYLIQVSSIFGSWIISFLLIFVNYGIYQSIKEPRHRRRYAQAILILLGGFYIYGFISVKFPPREETLSVATLQPDIHYPSHISMADSLRIAGQQIRLTGKIPHRWNPDLVIWPETAVPSDFTRDPDMLPAVQEAARRQGAYFLIGAAIDEEAGLFNGVVFLDPDGTVIDIYKKRYLVPFSEYQPTGGMWNVIDAFVPNTSQNFVKGSRPGVFQFPAGEGRMAGRRFAVAVCSEDNISSLFRRYRLKGAEFAVILLNNGWFKNKTGLIMHGEHSIMRAVENRIPVIRSSNNGWTALIDRYGRVDTEGLAGVRQKKIFHYQIHPNKDVSVYSIIGDTFCWICSAFVIMSLFYEKRRV